MGEASRTVFVGNLAWTTTSEELSAFMGAVGTVVSAEVQVHADSGRSKGWGLVQYSNDSEAMAAIEQLNNAELGGRSVHVRLDRSTIDTTAGFAVFVGNLPWSTTDSDLTTLFAAYHPYDAHVKTNMAGRSRGFAILRFSSAEEGQAAISAMNGYEIDGRPLLVREDRDGSSGGGGGGGGGRRGGGGGGGGGGDHSSPQRKGDSNTLFVGNLAWGTTSEDLAAHFSGQTGLLSADVQSAPSGRSKGWGLVVFAAPDQAAAAAESMHDTLLHERRLTVRLDRK